MPSASTRHDGWTPERQGLFIATLAGTGSVTKAARAAGKSATAAYKLRERKGVDAFRRAWDTAQQMAYDRAFGIAITRSLDGYEEPRFYRGRQVGTVRRYDYRMMTAVLRTAPALTSRPARSEQRGAAARMPGRGTRHPSPPRE